MIANSVSRIGIARINRGTNTDVKRAPLNPKRETIDMMNPMKVAPVSPANVLAG